MPTNPVATTLVPVSQIRPNPDQPRKSFDAQELANLKASILERGLINPIAVLKQPGGDYLIMAGERRFRAVQELGWEQIDARIWPETTPRQETELVALVENLQRKDLNPIEVAKGYKALSEPPYNMSQEEIAKQVGKGQPAVALTMALLEQPAEIQEIISQEIISPTHMRFLGRIEDEKERIKMAKQAAAAGWSVQETEKQVNKLSNKGSDPSKVSDTGKKRSASVVPEQASDPLAERWSDIRSATASGGVWWDVKYGPHKLPTGDPLNGWFFFASPLDGQATKEALAGWFQQMANALTAEDRSAKTEKEVPIRDTTPVSDLRSAIPDFKPRLPISPSEEAELLKIAENGGPKAVYEWIYGQGSFMVQAVPFSTWQEAGCTAVDGLKEILAGIKQAQRSRVPA